MTTTRESSSMLYKKLIGSLIAFGISASCYGESAPEDWYAGVQLGYSKSSYTRGNLGITSIGGIFTTPVKLRNDGIGGRVYMGRRYNRFFGAELGYTRYEDVTIKNAYGVDSLNGRIKPQAVDLVILSFLPISEKFNAYSKVGIAYLDVSATASISGVKSSVEDNDIRPAYGLGLTYNFQENWTADLSWTRVHGEGGRLENSTLTALGIAYHFR